MTDIIPDNMNMDGTEKTQFQKDLEEFHGRKLGKVFQPKHKYRKKGVQPLNRRQEKFFHEFAKCGVKKHALKKAGYKNLNNTTTSNNIIKRHPKEFVAIMEEHGLSDDTLVVAIKQGLEANKPVINNLGEIVDNIPAHDTRHKFLDTALKIKGAYAPTQVETIQANINIDASKVREMSMEDIDALLEGKELKIVVPKAEVMIEEKTEDVE